MVEKNRLRAFLKVLDYIMKKLLCAALLCMSFPSLAIPIKVFCADALGKRWSWLELNYPVGGRWQKKQIGRNEYAYGYLIHWHMYKMLKEECAAAFPNLPYPRPAYSWADNWWSFMYEDPNTKIMFIPDMHLTIYREEKRPQPLCGK